MISLKGGLMDFFEVRTASPRKDVIEIFPSFVIGNSQDLMIRGGFFYAIWNEKTGLWSTDEYDVVRIVDEALWASYDKIKDTVSSKIVVRTMSDFSSKSWESYRRYIAKCPDNFQSLDCSIIFNNQVTTKKDYASHKLPYSLSDGSHDSWDELISTLYDVDERRKIEWAIGAILSGDSKKIQKFLVFYGDAGTGKSTVLNIIQHIFDGYYCIFDARALATVSNQFSMEVFKTNPLVAIQHDGDLSKIEDNSRLNSIVSHERMTINEKHKSLYEIQLNSFLLMATNKPVKITDGKSGLIRRLIDVNPSGRLIPIDKYNELMTNIDFEIGAIAQYCLNVYGKYGKHFYDSYRSSEMQYKTDVFFNFIDENYFLFCEQDGVSLKQAYSLYKEYCEETSLSYVIPMYMFREELKNYFKNFKQRVVIDGQRYRSYYEGFLKDKFSNYYEVIDFTDTGSEDNDGSVDEEVKKQLSDKNKPKLSLKYTDSIFDKLCSDCPAQYANDYGTPRRKWAEVDTKLIDIDTSKVHYVQIPLNHIVIDLDLKDAEGNKSAELNLAAAAEFPPTYAEFSQGGAGVHLHYIYDGDSTKLSRLYSAGIEVKVFSGNSSLRRRLTYCNNLDISHISGGLPLIKEKKMIKTTSVKSEKALRDLIVRNIHKEIHPATKPSIDFIYKILEDAYNSDLSYDVSDMSTAVLAFAANSTNQAPYCIRTVGQMRFKSKDCIEEEQRSSEAMTDDSKPLTFFDIEVFPNLLLVNYKQDGEGKPMRRLVNPSPAEIELMFDMRLVGYNNRGYDNHILYSRWLGKNLKDIYEQSKAIISGTKEEARNAKYRKAYDISYTDIYDFASSGNKMSLKKAEIEMGIHHQELGMDWNKPVPEHKWKEVSEYCDNDVLATEARFHWLKGDWSARKILASLADMTVNDTTNTLTTHFIFGDNRNPQNEFNYRNLGNPVSRNDIKDSTLAFLVEALPDMMGDGTSPQFVSPIAPDVKSWLPYFPGYVHSWTKKENKNGKIVNIQSSVYRGIEVGEGGFVYSEPGIYTNVALLDITSQHPSSAIAECAFGPRYTGAFRDLVLGRVAIKHEDWDTVRSMLNGKLSPYVDQVLNGDMTADELAGALKTAINAVYGLSAATFPNPFKHPDNNDNLIAKRGALFMVDLMFAVQEQGYTVAHIKTDSIKIPEATPSIIEFVIDFGKRYGYNFEHEATYDRMCLVNKSTYIAKYKTGKHAGEWTATGAQFAQPYVFKTLFSHEPITFEDMCETKNVKTALYLDMNEGYPLHSYSEEEYNEATEGMSENDLKKYKGPKVGDLVETHNYVFIGRAGQFSPIVPDAGGGVLVREQDGKYVSATDADGYRWLESEMVRSLHMEKSVDISFYRKKVDEAIADISQYGDFEWFVSDEPDPNRIEVP